MTDFSALRSTSVVQSAYGKSQALNKEQIGATVAGDNSGSTDFSELLAKAASQAVQNVRAGDEVSMAGLSGKAGIQDVVEATMAMESTVRVSVAVRDKFVAAYQDIMRMQI